MSVKKNSYKNWTNLVRVYNVHSKKNTENSKTGVRYTRKITVSACKQHDTVSYSI